MAGKLDLALTVRAVDQATAPLRKVGRAIQDVGRKTGLARAGAAAADLGRSLHGVGREAHRFARRAGLLALAAGASGIGLAGRFAAAGDSIAKTADKLGLGVVELQRYRYAAERAGVEQNTFDMAMQRFTRRVAEAAAGTGEAEAALRYLGIQLTDTNGDIRPAGEMLEEVADALARVEDPALRVRIAFKLFDSEGVSLVNMLSEGSAEMRRLGDEAERLGVLTDEQARSAEAYTDEVGKFRRALSFLGHVIGESLLPELTQLARRLTEFLVAARPGAAEEMRKALDSLAAAAAWLNTQWKRLAPVLGAWLERLQETFPPIRDWIAVAREWVDGAGLVTTAVIALAAALAHRLALAVLGLFRPLLRLGFALAGVGLRMTWMAGTAIIGMAKGLRGLLAPLRLAALAVFRLGIAFLATPIGWIVAGIAAVAGAAYLIYRNWEGIVGWFQRMWDGILAAFKVDELIAWLSGFSLKDTLGAWVAGVVDRYVSVWNGILAAFKVDELIAWLSGFSLTDTLTGWFDGVADAFAAAWADVRAAFGVDQLLAELREFDFVNIGIGWIENLWSGVSDTWRQLSDWRRAAVANLTGWLPDWIKNRLGIDDAVDAQSSASTQAVSTLAPEPAPSFISPSSRALVGGEVRIVIDGLPRGSRIDSVRSDNPDVPLEVTSGYVMAGAGCCGDRSEALDSTFGATTPSRARGASRSMNILAVTSPLRRIWAANRDGSRSTPTCLETTTPLAATSSSTRAEDPAPAS